MPHINKSSVHIMKILLHISIIQKEEVGILCIKSEYLSLFYTTLLYTITYNPIKL